MEKRKTTFSLVGIAICTILLASLASPVIAIASDVSLNPKDTLGVYGNANGDNIIDQRDVTYVEEILSGKKRATKLADANYDGKINEDDITQIKLIIEGKEKELTIIDSEGNAKTVSKPIKRIVVLNPDCAQAIRALGDKDRIVGIEASIEAQPKFFPEISRRPSIGVAAMTMIDIEKIQQLDPDIVIAYAPGIYNPGHEDLEDQLEPEITIVRLNLGMIPAVRDEMRTLGYLLDAKKKADEYVKWYDKRINKIEGKVSEISDKDKPWMYWEMGTVPPSYVKGAGMVQIPKRMTANDKCIYSDAWEKAGVKNIAADVQWKRLATVPIFGELEIMKGFAMVEPEWVVGNDPEVIVGFAGGFNMRAGGYETDNPKERDVQKIYFNKYLGVDPNKISMKSYYDEIVDLFGTTSAGTNNRIHVIHHTIACGPGSLVSLAYYAKWFHPRLTSDLDPQAIHQEYVNKFCDGIRFDVRRHGVFVYPPLP